MTIEELEGRWALGIDRSEDYIEWATDQLVAGKDTPSLGILASLDLERPVYRSEVEHYFNRCLSEAALDWPPDRAAARDRFAQWLCRQIVTGKGPIRRHYADLTKLYRASDYSEPRYALWDNLAEELAVLEGGDRPIWTEAAELADLDEYLRRAARAYLEVARRGLPAQWYLSDYCTACTYVGLSARQPWDYRWLPTWCYRWVFGRHRAYRAVCASCGATGPLPLATFTGIFEYLKGDDQALAV